MSRASDPAIHAPGFHLSHCLPPAGLKRPVDLDVYRFNRVVPLFTPDPCVGPSDGQLICPPCGQDKRNDLHPAAGFNRPESDSFQFYDTRRSAPKPQGACSCPVFAHNPPCTSLGPIIDPLQCPCINRPAHMTGPEAQAPPPPTHPPTQRAHNGPVPHAFKNYGDGIYNYYVNNRPVDGNTLNKIPLCDNSRDGAVAPTPHMMNVGPADGSSSHGGGRGRGGGGGGRGVQNNNIVNVGGPGNCVAYHCQHPYFPSDYLCRPVFDRKYLDDCPEQYGPHPDHYTFL